MAFKSAFIFTALVGFLTALIPFLWSRRLNASRAALPPGPKSIPILGNIRDIPPKQPWLFAAKLAKLYGDVVYMHILGRGMVFLNSAEAAYDLLDKRGSIYSDRPSSTMVAELCGFNKMVPFNKYGDRSRRQRKLMHKALGSHAIPRYYPLLQTWTVAFLHKLVQAPADYVEHSRWYSGGFTLSVVFGYEPAPHNDKFLMLATEWLELATEVVSGGAVWFVDLIPVLRHLPAWFPGAGFKRKAEQVYNKTEEFATRPYEFAKSNVASGIFKPSFCSAIMEDQEMTGQLEYDLKWTAISMYSASADTTIATISNFLLAMMEHPEVLAKAREEIDKVVGTERLPGFGDRKHLTYVDAVVSEIWRWAVPSPLNLPHCLKEDDIYRGMLIPKGSWVIANIWSMLQDEKLYTNPSQFDPERFMEEVDEETRCKRDPRKYIFGFGRRLCPGASLVESSIWLLVVCVIATLDISKPKDEYGRVIEPNPQFDNEIMRIPNPFKCSIQPRSEQAAKLIMEVDLYRKDS